MNKVVCFLLLLLSIVSVSAQEQWDLAYCVKLGKENSYKVMVAAMEKQVAERQKQSVVSYYIPNVSLNGGQNYNFGSAIDPTTNTRVSSNIATTQLSLDASVDLFNWSNVISYQLDQLAVSMAELSEKEVWFYYQNTILSSFFDIVGLQEYLEIQQEQLRNSEANYNRVLKEVEAGAKPKSDLYDIEYIYNSEKISIEVTENSLDNKKLQFIHLLNIDTRELGGFELVNKEESMELFTDYTFNPLLEKLRLQNSVLYKDKQQLKAQNLPRLTASYQYGSFYSKPFNSVVETQVYAFSKQLGDNKSHFVGIRLSIPVFQGGIVYRNVRKKNVEINLNSLKIKEKETELSNENVQLEQEINQLNRLKDKLKKNIEMSSKSFVTTQVKYENGKVDIFSFNAAKNQLLNAQYALIKNSLSRQFLEKKLQLNNSNTL
ncbi:TolC family protein [Myroides pelagicus]|uniref:TolC family protein n=1 Tax=Myroides pelagicus TaxID=270914 RepID=A0A7K1GKY0_9FLAO|nr:TolC family protein [Myroides pelagicus]MEC4112646.1 TolC family protein [Myroides pelagicus]MTH29476.1 TolC family protein [Myroides pelagicus]